MSCACGASFRVCRMHRARGGAPQGNETGITGNGARSKETIGSGNHQIASLTVLLFGVKRHRLVALHVPAFDRKRTFVGSHGPRADCFKRSTMSGSRVSQNVMRRRGTFENLGDQFRNVLDLHSLQARKTEQGQDRSTPFLCHRRRLKSVLPRTMLKMQRFRGNDTSSPPHALAKGAQSIALLGANYQQVIANRRWSSPRLNPEASRKPHSALRSRASLRAMMEDISIDA